MRILPAALIALCSASSALAQDDPVRTIPFDGIEVFCHILHHAGMKPLPRFTEIFDAAEQTILIEFGVRAKIGKFGGSRDVRSFLDSGGNLLIATDNNLSSNRLGAHVTGETVEQTDPGLQYRHDHRCPLLLPDRAPARMRGHPLLAMLQKGVATNCPSVLTLDPKTSIAPLLQYGDRSNACAVAASPRRAPPWGRAVIAAGQGMFLNGMMLQSDNDNFAFALNTVRWLREGRDGKPRTRALFIVDGRIVTNFDANLSPPPGIPVPPIQSVDRLLRGLEDERAFHHILNDALGDDRIVLVSILMAAATIALLIYSAKKFLDGRFTLETRAPRLVGVVPHLGATRSAIAQQQDALWRRSNLGGEASLLARAWFRREFSIVPTPATGLVATGAFWQRPLLQRDARQVLHLALATTAPALTRRDFARLLSKLAALSDARRAGKLTLLVDGKTVK